MSPWTGRLVAFGLAGLAAVLVVVLAPAWLVGTTRAIAAYDVGTTVLLVIFWTLAMHDESEDTKARASVEDPGRNAVFGAVLIGAAVALSAAVTILGRGPHVTTVNEKAIAYGVGIAAIVLGWTLIHTMFTFRYAHLFYYRDADDNQADRGLDFPGTPDPNDFDFAYLAFGIGMTYQVADVRITDRGIRRLVLFQGLVSFVYNTAIVALVINVLSGLLH
jgi:uncharacterized membrane protein